MIITLSAKERESLQWLLERSLPELHQEIAHTDDRGFRRFLKEQKIELETVIELLKQAAPREAA